MTRFENCRGEIVDLDGYPDEQLDLDAVREAPVEGTGGSEQGEAPSA